MAYSRQAWDRMSKAWGGNMPSSLNPLSPDLSQEIEQESLKRMTADVPQEASWKSLLSGLLMPGRLNLTEAFFVPLSMSPKEYMQKVLELLPPEVQLTPYSTDGLRLASLSWEKNHFDSSVTLNWELRLGWKDASLSPNVLGNGVDLSNFGYNYVDCSQCIDLSNIGLIDELVDHLDDDEHSDMKVSLAYSVDQMHKFIAHFVDFSIPGPELTSYSFNANIAAYQAQPPPMPRQFGKNMNFGPNFKPSSSVRNPNMP